MINVTATADFGGYRESGFPVDFDQTDNEDFNCDFRQRKMLTDLICSKIDDEGERQTMLNQLDSLSRSDAEDMIFAFLTEEKYK